MKITISDFRLFKKQKVKPIDGLNIPGITIPSHLVSRIRQTQALDTLSINIRSLFNSLTPDNLLKVKEKLNSIVIEKARNQEMIEEIAQEILSNFIVSENNIKNYMFLLNAISQACVLLTPKTESKAVNVSPTIGNFFLEKCKTLIFNFIKMENIRTLAKMDLDDSDQLDIYNREREKITNLILTICYLYEQRKTKHIKLSALQLFHLINTILKIHETLLSRMRILGDPMEDECSDEMEYEILRKMCSLYAEQLYTFMYKEAKEFVMDTTVVNNTTLSELVNKFRNDVVPNLSEAYLISKCESIDY